MGNHVRQQTRAHLESVDLFEVVVGEDGRKMHDLIETVLQAGGLRVKEDETHQTILYKKRPASLYRIADALTRNLRASASMPASSSISSPLAWSAVVKNSLGIRSSDANAFASISSGSTPCAETSSRSNMRDPRST